MTERNFVYGLMIGIALLLLVSGMALGASRDLCFTSRDARDCAENPNRRADIPTAFGHLELMSREGQTYLAGVLKRPTACAEWQLSTMSDFAGILVLELRAEDPSSVCLDNVVAPQALFRSLSAEPDTMFAVLLDGEVVYFGKLGPEQSSSPKGSHGLI